MFDYLSTKNQLHVRGIDFTLEEYLFVLQVVCKENISIAYASIFDRKEFKRNVPSENEEEYLAKHKHDAEFLLAKENCKHLQEYMESELQSYVQEAASTLEDFRFTGADVQKLLSNLLHNRSESLDDASVKDILSLIKSMYESGALDSGDAFEKHFIQVPSKYNTMCPNCNREGYAIEGLDYRCEFCGHVSRWSEQEHRYYPNLTNL